MKVQIRHSIFETNSSSIHAISIMNDYTGAEKAKEYIKENGPSIEVNAGEFGWKVMQYDDPETKLSYIYTLACKGYWDQYLERRQFIDNALRSVGLEPEFQAMKQKIFEGYEDEVYVEAENDEWFSLDHANCWEHEFIDKVFKDQNFLLDFVFGNAYLYTGNDNGDKKDRPCIGDESDTWTVYWKFN